MKGKTLKQFKEYYAHNLKKEAERFQMPLPSIEEEFQKVAMKTSHVRSLERANSKIMEAETQYVEKIQTFVNGSNNKDLKDLKVLNELAGYNEDAKKELTSLREGQYVANALTHKNSHGNLGNATSGFDTYLKVQKIVDKVILNTVTELGSDLNILPDKQKANVVIDRLSGIKDFRKSTEMQEHSINSAETLRLPKIKRNSKKVQSIVLQSVGQSIVLPSSATLGPNSLLSTETSREKVLAGFFKKEKKQKHKIDREKEQIRRDCIGSFIKGNEKIKGFSYQYLNTLSQHNGKSLENLSSKDFDSPSLNYQSSPNLAPTSSKSLGKSFNGFRSYRAIENPNSGLSLSPPKWESKQIENLSIQDNEKPFFGQDKWKKSPNKRNLKKATITNLGNSEIDLTEEEWMKEGGLGKALAKKDEYIFEGMGLLTLHTEYKNATKNIKDFEVDHFDMTIKSLKRKDVDYVQKKTGVNLKHSLYDRVVNERDVMRFEPSDLPMLL